MLLRTSISSGRIKIGTHFLKLWRKLKEKEPSENERNNKNWVALQIKNINNKPKSKFIPLNYK